MPDEELQIDSLTVYKNQPARVVQTGKKLFIELPDGSRLSVRPKDVILLHPGPAPALSRLQPPPGDMQTACELLAGQTTTLPELAELVYDEFSPAAAWAIWQQLADGLYVDGVPEAIEVRTPDVVAHIQAERAAKAAAEQQWQEFLGRLRDGRYQSEDAGYLQEIVALATKQRENSKILRTLGQSETPEQAHALLLKIGYWDEMVNPYPQRLGLPTQLPIYPITPLPSENRRDLTHLSSFAIDDEDNQDPDDALSLDGERLWVHVADVAALIPPGSPADEEACARAANLYLPEGTVPMLPPVVTEALGLGLAEVSPALSFGLDLAADGGIIGVEIVPSWVRVTRLTYEQVEARLAEEPFATLYTWAQRFEARRRENGAVFIALPEVKVRVEDGEVVIRPLPSLRSRALVMEAMLMTGEAVARYAVQHQIPLPFTIQDPPDSDERQPVRPSEMLALRKKLQRGQQVTAPGIHAGLGLNLYAQATSPLRRYLDLVVHQQLRAHLCDQPLLNAAAIIERVGTADAVIGSVRQAERLSNTHWKLVYLLQNPGWEGEGIVLDQRGNRYIVLLPDLDLETELYIKGSPPLDSVVALASTGVDLPRLEAHFRA
ncbi:MAG TPA: RNB domain-containing ribonuclease [Chloroflexota bacterium]|nr:RNB domain-containing ribonuclease [Chloroflexota bacterium]HUM69538.1 RNB domain-containing ribonuclease [Chloroflexota bacterium]